MYYMLSVQVAPNPDGEPTLLLHTADQDWIALVLRLYRRRLERAMALRRPVPAGVLRIVESGDADGRVDDGPTD